MDDKAEEREEERAMLARYHAQQPQPPAALDDAIRAAARESVESTTRARARTDGQQARRSGSSTSPWFGLAAVLTMVALVLPGLLREPQLPPPASVEAMAQFELAEGAEDAALAPAPPQADLTASRKRVLQARDVPLALAPSAQRPGGGRPGEAVTMQAPASTTPVFASSAPMAMEVPPRGGGVSAAGSDVAAQLIPQQRLQARFRPTIETPETVSVTLLDTMVVIEGDWPAREDELCEPLLALDRYPGESTRASVERIAAGPAEAFVFLRLESLARVRLVHCTQTGWIVSVR